MKKMIRCIVLIIILCFMITGCNSGKPQRGYSISNPVNGEHEYTDLKSVTQKETLYVDGKEYLPEKDCVYYLFDIDMMYSYDWGDGFDFNTVSYYDVGTFSDDTYKLKQNISQLLSDLSESEWTGFNSSEKKNIKLVFEGPKMPEDSRFSTFYIGNPFLIDAKEIVIE